MIAVTERIALEEREVSESFIRASGSGGQNVNKVATAVQLRFDARHSPSLPDAVRHRLETLAGSLLTDDGEIVITARRSRSQEENRADALERLLALIRRAAEPAVPRRPTRPTLASKVKRLDAKRRRSETKLTRARRPSPDD